MANGESIAVRSGVEIHSAKVQALEDVLGGVRVVTLSITGAICDQMAMQTVWRMIASGCGRAAYVVCIHEALLATSVPVSPAPCLAVAYVATAEQAELIRQLRGHDGRAMPLVFAPDLLAAARRWVAMELGATSR